MGELFDQVFSGDFEYIIPLEVSVEQIEEVKTKFNKKRLFYYMLREELASIEYRVRVELASFLAENNLNKEKILDLFKIYHKYLDMSKTMTNFDDEHNWRKLRIILFWLGHGKNKDIDTEWVYIFKTAVEEDIKLTRVDFGEQAIENSVLKQLYLINKA